MNKIVPSDAASRSIILEDERRSPAVMANAEVHSDTLSNRTEKGKRRFDEDGGGEGVLPWPVRTSTAHMP